MISLFGMGLIGAGMVVCSFIFGIWMCEKGPDHGDRNVQIAMTGMVLGVSIIALALVLTIRVMP